MADQTHGRRVLAVYDQASTERALRRLLQTTCDVRLFCVSFTQFDPAISLLATLPALVLIECIRASRECIGICRAVRQTLPGVSLALLCEAEDDVTLSIAWEAGARGIIQPDASVAAVEARIRRILAGERLFTESQMTRIQDWQSGIGMSLRELTRRELSVLRLMLLGMHNKDIASELVISENTVEKHVSAVLIKSGVKSRPELFAILVRRYASLIE